MVVVTHSISAAHQFIIPTFRSSCCVSFGCSSTATALQHLRQFIHIQVQFTMP